MPRVIEVRTGARLHFGPLASGATEGRCFGGIGMMVDAPAIAFRAVEHDVERFIGCSPETSERIRRLREAWDVGHDSYVPVAPPISPGRLKTCPTKQVPLSWEFETPPVEHAGFGTGTQLSLAVASVLTLRDDGSQLPLSEIAQRSGRGRRSAIGLHGFAHGGFLVDAGQAGQAALGELAVRLPVPEAWRIVILRPRHSDPGLSGTQELAAFEALAPMASSLTGRLCRLTLMKILPALQASDCQAFGSAVAEYGRAIGDYFEPVQGGVFADARVRELIDQRPALGRQLVQSSWGPSVVAFAPSEAAAEEFQRELFPQITPDEWMVTVASPRNQGATIRVVAGQGQVPGSG